MKTALRLLSVVFLVPLLVNVVIAQGGNAPHLEKRGATTQLIVDGQPFLVLGGELHNSSSSNLEYMKPLWPKLAAMGLNTVITPLSWELIEPREGSYDYALVDGLLAQAREAHERVVFLWLASWKNGMSSYAPVWVKQDSKRFPRVVIHGREIEVFSPMSAATQEADARAFAALMRHIKEVDAQHTVIMMQVENEVGVLGDSRDRSEAANRAFYSPIPAELTSYLAAHRESLYPSLRALWEANGAKTSGTWAQVFGDTPKGDEIFMAWHYARFIQAVMAKGKQAYDLPMYVNTWLGSEEAIPGTFPSGCPEPWVVDVWRAAGTAIDLYSPDLYASEFEEWSRRYHRAGNPLFMPETRGGNAGAANVFYALGEEAGMGFSPFAIEDATDPKSELADSYHALASILPQLAEHQASGDAHGFVLSKQHPAVDFTMNGYALHVQLDDLFGDRAENGYGLILGDGKDQFLGLGRGFKVTLRAEHEADRPVGIGAVDEGWMEEGKWVPGRRLNGDENDQGQSWRFDSRGVHLEKVSLYRFE
ncbi:glycoside hydrolase family 42 [Acidobacteria bacterium AB60]|nr:glycoside hydrolase family 42 [Acidobacteria bacterium AB60]